MWLYLAILVASNWPTQTGWPKLGDPTQTSNSPLLWIHQGVSGRSWKGNCHPVCCHFEPISCYWLSALLSPDQFKHFFAIYSRFFAQASQEVFIIKQTVLSHFELGWSWASVGFFFDLFSVWSPIISFLLKLLVVGAEEAVSAAATAVITPRQ